MITVGRQTLKIILGYGLLLAAAAFALEWLQYQYFLKSYSAEIYIVLIAFGFAALGIWIGIRLTAKSDGAAFLRNDAAIASLGISPREMEVLSALASGQSNKEIARSLSVSPNTIKTHIANLFEKLDVDRRVRAIEKAKFLRIIA